MPKNEKDEIRILLTVNELSYAWLSKQLFKIGMSADRTEISSTLNDRRKGPKSEKIVEASLKVLHGYVKADKAGFAEFAE